MAGRVLVIEFDDKANAELWKRHFDQLVPQTRVTGIYLLPKLFCKCNREKAEAKHSKMHSKYKIFVCVHCGRPSQFWNKGIPIRLRMALGRNLDELEPKA